MFAVQFAGAAAALAMIGFRQIRQLEISREGFRHLVGAGQVHLGDDLLRLEHEFGRGSLLRAAAHGLAMLDQQSAQFFDRFEQFLPDLLDQHLPEHCAQRAHIPAQWIIFRGFVGARGQFRQTRLLVVGLPQQFGFVRAIKRM